MKKIFIALAALATIAACNKAEVIGTPEGEEIAFNKAFVDNATKSAEDPSYSASGQELKAFQVWGSVNGGAGVVSIFNNNTVTGTIGSKIVNGVETHVWTCEKKQYWINGAKYNFAALVNADEEKVTLGNVENGTNNLLPIAVEFTADGATDLLYAKSTENIVGSLTNNAPVNFTFAHLLSKVKFTVINVSKAATDYSIKLNKIVITGNSEGTYDVPGEEWSTTSTSKGYTVKTITVNKDTPDEGEECETELLLIPGTFDIDFDVEIYLGETKLSTQHSHFTTPLAASTSYNFIVKVAVGQEITFAVVANAAWTDSEAIVI